MKRIRSFGQVASEVGIDKLLLERFSNTYQSPSYSVPTPVSAEAQTSPTTSVQSPCGALLKSSNHPFEAQTISWWKRQWLSYGTSTCGLCHMRSVLNTAATAMPNKIRICRLKLCTKFPRTRYSVSEGRSPMVAADRKMLFSASGVAVPERISRTQLLPTAVAMERVAAPPRNRNWITAAQRRVLYSRRIWTQHARTLRVCSLRLGISNLLLIPPEKVDYKRFFADFGVDGMIASKFRTSFWNIFKVDVPFLDLRGSESTLGTVAAQVEASLAARMESE